jgi:nitrilase
VAGLAGTFVKTHMGWSKRLKISVIQMNSQGSKDENFKQAEGLVRAAADSDCPDLVALPEMCLCLTGDRNEIKRSGESVPGGATVTRLSLLAKELKVYLHVGSIVEVENDEHFNTTVVFDRQGQLVAKYRKIHRFDAVLPNGTELAESKVFGRGHDIVTYQASGVTIGCTICYDLRFPALFRELRRLNSSVIVVPAAFHFSTGADHWELLLRSRAVETQCYIVAPAQVHDYDAGKKTNFGHSIVVDPWGQVVAQVSNKVGWT